jgi:hypothetical protein
MAGVFGCRIQDMPFTYLGLPMGITRPRVEHYEPIMNRMEAANIYLFSAHSCRQAQISQLSALCISNTHNVLNFGPSHCSWIL